MRFRLRDYLRQGAAHSDPHLIKLLTLIRVAHSDPHLIELLAPDPGIKVTTYLDFYLKNTCYSAKGQCWGSGSAGSARFWASRIWIR